MTYDNAWIRAELAEIAALAAASQAKGKRLEAMVARLFEALPGLRFVGSNIMSAYATEEIDHLFWNDQLPGGLHFLDCPLIIECKSSGSPVGSREVRYFADLLADKGRRSGILVALAGVTGDDEGPTAGQFHLTVMLTKGVTVLVVNGTDLEAINNPADLLRLLQTRMIELVRRQL